MIFLDTIPSLTLPVAVGGLISLILSISEPKQAHAKLAREQALLRCLIDAVSETLSPITACWTRASISFKNRF
jgi:hypothetical protein